MDDKHQKDFTTYTPTDPLSMVPTTQDSDETVVNIDLLSSIKNFMNDLSNVTTNQNFIDYCIIVNRIDTLKIKSYAKLVSGFEAFFANNVDSLKEGKFEDLADPNISYVTCNGTFSFNFQKTFEEADEENQDLIKDHLNHIWILISNKNKSPEEIYINKVFNDLKKRFSNGMSSITKDEQMVVAKDLFSDFQQQNLDISIVIKTACQKARNILLSNGSENHTKTLVLIDTVEEIDINNFNMIQFMTLVSKVGALFADEENNPINDLLANVFSGFSIAE